MGRVGNIPLVFLQVFREIGNHFVKEIVAGISTIDGVILIGEKEEIAVPVGSDECPDVFHGVLDVYVVVGGAVHDEQLTLQLVGNIQ